MNISVFIPLIVLMLCYLITMVVVVQVKKDMSIANFVWGGGCLLIALYTFFTNKPSLSRHVILTTMIVLWAVRLIVYIYARYRGNDPRFATWKENGVHVLLLHIGYIFGLQTLLMLAMSLPIIAINTSDIPATLGYLDYVGIVLWLLGYIFESVSDHQLFKFTRDKNNHGRVMRYGLWRYSRHPNYFGEVLMWWGIFALALSGPYGLITIIAPLTITILLLYVTGIPWVEKAMEHNEEYQEYKGHTNAFFPWFPKK